MKNKTYVTSHSCLNLKFWCACLLAAFAMSSSQATDSADSLKSQLDDPEKNVSIDDDESAYRVLFIGDSITRHGVNRGTIEQLGWDHVAGMAASKEENDYSHLLVDMLQKDMPGRKVTPYYHLGGGGGSVIQRLNGLNEVTDVQPQLVVIQLGEHEKEKDGAEYLATNLARFIDALRAFDSSPEVICVGIWNPSKNREPDGSYRGWSRIVDDTMARVCEEKNVPYGSVAPLSLNPQNYGTGESPGVRWHPNDAGHKAYAELLYQLYTEQ